jgi:Transglutaminase-like superfamily
VSSASSLDDLPPRVGADTPSSDLERPTGSSRIRTTVQFISDAAFFLQIFAFAAAVHHLLRLKLSRVAGLLELGGDPSVGHAPEDRVKKITAYVELAIQRGRPIVRPGCLTRGLTRYYFLRRAGMDVTLCFGMGEREKKFMGHCWLAKDGEPFLEAEDPRPRYVEVYRISRAGGQASVPGGVGGLQRFSKS